MVKLYARMQFAHVVCEGTLHSTRSHPGGRKLSGELIKQLETLSVAHQRYVAYIGTMSIRISWTLKYLNCILCSILNYAGRISFQPNHTDLLTFSVNLQPTSHFHFKLLFKSNYFVYLPI